MKIIRSNSLAERANIFIGIMIMVIGAVVIWKIYQTAKQLLPPTPPAPPVAPTNAPPGGQSPDVTSVEWFQVPEVSSNAAANPNTIYLAYGLMCTNQIDGGWYGIPGGDIPFMVVNRDNAGSVTWGSLSNFMQSNYDINVDGGDQRTIYGWQPDGNGGWTSVETTNAYLDGYSGNEYLSVTSLQGYDAMPVWTNGGWLWVGVGTWNGLYWVTLQGSSNGVTWNDLTAGTWMHSGDFIFYEDTNAPPVTGLYRVNASWTQPSPFPAITTNGTVR